MVVGTPAQASTMAGSRAGSAGLKRRVGTDIRQATRERTLTLPRMALE